MEYTKEQLEAIFEEKSLKAIELMEKWNSLDRALASMSNNRNDISCKISELQTHDVLVPETFVVRKQTLTRMISILQKKSTQAKKEYAQVLLELDNITEDLIKISKNDSSKR